MHHDICRTVNLACQHMSACVHYFDGERHTMIYHMIFALLLIDDRNVSCAAVTHKDDLTRSLESSTASSGSALL